MAIRCSGGSNGGRSSTVVAVLLVAVVIVNDCVPKVEPSLVPQETATTAKVMSKTQLATPEPTANRRRGLAKLTQIDGQFDRFRRFGQDLLIADRKMDSRALLSITCTCAGLIAPLFNGLQGCSIKHVFGLGGCDRNSIGLAQCRQREL